AESPRDFVEEWIQSDWKTMAPWTVPPGLAGLQAKLHEEAFFDYQSVRSCGPGRLQVEIASDDAGGSLFFLVEGTGPVYRMLNVGPKANPGCNGPNRFKG